MKNIFVLAISLASSISYAQWPEFNRVHPVSCQWPAFNYQAHGYFENVFVIDTIPNFYDGYITFGRGNICHPDSVVNYSRNFSAKCNSEGDLTWWNRYDTPLIDENQQWYNWPTGNPGGIIKCNDGKYASIFTTFVEGDDNDNDTRDYLVKLDFNGGIADQYLVDSSIAKYAFHGIIEDPTDSTYIAHGWYQDSLDVINNYEPDAFLLKMDSLGHHIWQKTYPNTFGSVDLVKALDGGYWLCAATPTLGECPDGFFLNNDLLLIKTDAMGNEEDRMQLGGCCGKEVATVYEYEVDKVVLVGRLTNEVNGQNEMYAGYYYSTLIEQQQNTILLEITERKEYLPTYNGDFVDLHVIPNEGYIIVCDNQLSPDQGAGSDWRWMGGLLMLDSNRDSLWFRKYSYYNNFPGTGLDYPASHYLLDSKPTPDGGFVCSGYIDQRISDPNPYLLTPWLFKVDSLGCLEPGCQDVGVSEIVIGLQNTMSVYPNPASSVANISFSFPSDYAPPKNSELVVIDMHGREVLRQFASIYGQSNTSVEMDVSRLPRGMYTVHWVSGNAWLDSISLIKQ